jgi:NADPH:quinone reductase-like Zn-dependent oxidoreductase
MPLGIVFGEMHTWHTWQASGEEKDMKAIRIHEKGGPETLIYEEAPRPMLMPGDALVRVYASAITKDELTRDPTYQTAEGEPRTPSIPGHEFSGVVEELPPDTKAAKVGEEVYGLASFYRDGSAAEFIAIHADDLAAKPKTLDHVHAAAVPLAALTAWQALFSHAMLTRGQRVLIHGGAGGVGSFAVQMANWAGATVIATAAANNHDFLRQLGAHEVIDYAKVCFEDKVSDVNVVFDTIGGDTLERSYGVLRQGGTLVSIVEPPSAENAKAQGIKGEFFIVEPNRTQLEEIGRLIDTGCLYAFVDTVLPLEQAPQAFEQGLKGHSRGKIVLRIAG